MFWDIPLQDSCNGISLDIPLWYIQVLLGISRDRQGYLCSVLRDIQGYPESPFQLFWRKLSQVIFTYEYSKLSIPGS